MDGVLMGLLVGLALAAIFYAYKKIKTKKKDNGSGGGITYTDNVVDSPKEETKEK